MPKPRRFNYTPVFYDPVKERIEEARKRVAKAEEEENTRANNERLFVPGQRIRGAFQRALDDRRTPTGNSRLIRTVLLLTLIVIIAFFWYFADGMSLLYKALNQSIP